MAVFLCASLAAVYLTQEASQAGATDLADRYRLCALLAGALTALPGGLGLLLSAHAAPLLWAGMHARALPVVIVTMLSGLATAVLLLRRTYRLARATVILATACLLGSWGLSQYPYLIAPAITVASAANEPGVILMLVISMTVGMAVILPALCYLFFVFSFSRPRPEVTYEGPQGDRSRETEGE
jgi:cytochrome d ubiquinol oxidase subunit II